MTKHRLIEDFDTYVVRCELCGASYHPTEDELVTHPGYNGGPDYLGPGYFKTIEAIGFNCEQRAQSEV